MGSILDSKKTVFGISSVGFLAFFIAYHWHKLPDPKNGVVYYYETLSEERKVLKKEEIDLLPDWNGRDVYFLIHGYTESANAAWIHNMTRALLGSIPSCVVVTVDHWNYLHFSRPVMSSNINIIAQDIAQMLILLEEAARVRLSEVHILGFSIGGRIAGAIAPFMSSGNKIGRITGLDPSFPWEPSMNPNDYLDDSDAEIVVIIRTSRIGMLVPTVSFDFTVNGGFLQPGCEYHPLLYVLQEFCSHHRVQKLFAESLRMGQGSFVGCHCLTWDTYNDNSCICMETNTFGLHINTSLKGTFFLKTNPKSPFSIT